MIKDISNLGDAGVYCDFGIEVNRNINSEVIKYFKVIKEKNIEGINNITPSYNKLIISFDLSVTNYSKVKNQIEKLAFSYSMDFSVIGKTGGSQFTVNINSQEYIKQDIETIKEIWKTSLGRYVGQTT